MFEDSLLESGGRLKKRNPWATALSFAVEIAGVGLLVLLPLIYTEALPVRVMWNTEEIFTPPTQSAPRAPEQPVTVRHEAQTQSEIIDNTLIAPARIPPRVNIVIDPIEGPGPGGPVRVCPGCIVSNEVPRDTSVALEIMRRQVIAVPDRVLPSVVRRSEGVMAGFLIRQVKPVYPPIARSARIQGAVVLTATIGHDGTIQNLSVMSGHPMLVGAAVDAVKQWRYKPYQLNGQPVDVETSVTVNFTLN